MSSLQCIYSSSLGESCQSLKFATETFQSNKEMEIHICVIFQSARLYTFQATHILDLGEYPYKGIHFKIIFFYGVNM